MESLNYSCLHSAVIVTVENNCIRGRNYSGKFLPSAAMQKSPRVKSNLAVKRNEFEYLLDIRVQQSDVVAGARRKRSTRFRAHLLLPECGWVMAIDCERLSSLVMVFYEGEWRQIKPKQGGFRRFLATFEQLKYCRALVKWSKVKEVFLLEFEFQKSRKTVTLFHVMIMNMCAWIFPWQW